MLHFTPSVGTLERNDIGHSDHARLRHGVIDRSAISIQTVDRRSQHHAAIAGLAHQGKGRPDDMERSAQMHVQDHFEVLVCDLLQRAAPNDPGVVDQDVDPPVMIER